jgi:chromosome segregation ATPase
MKNYEDVCKELQFFKNLKPEEREEELKKLVEKKAGLGEEIVSNLKNITETERKIKSAEAKKETIEIEYTETRQKRQNASAFGKDPEKFRTSISALKDMQEVQEDAIIGLKRKIENLKNEMELLENEKSETDQMILRLKSVSLIERANKQGVEFAKTLEEVARLANELGEGFSEFRGGAKTIVYSNWEGISRIGKLYLVGDIGPEDTWENGRLKDLFNIQELYTKLQQEREIADLGIK